jgi:phosphoglycerol transferase MdoB-like AlkP superfamily enzyme
VWQALQSLLHVAQIGRSRSSVINPLQGTLCIVIFAFLVLAVTHAENWLLVFFASVTAAVFLLLLGAYIYFMIRDPAALRSERYSLAKTAIEKQRLGDSLSGLREVIDVLDDREDARLLGPGSTERKS